MRHSAFIFCLLTGFFLSSVGTAQSYFGVGAGMVSIDEESRTAVGLTSVVEGVDDEAFAGMLYGGYKLNEYVSVELSYLESASLDYEATIGAVSGTQDLYLEAWTPAIHLHKKFGKASVFGFVGMAFWEARLNDKGLAINDDDSDLSFGVGAEFHSSDSWSVRGQWRRVEADGDITEGDADFFLLGIHRYF